MKHTWRVCEPVITMVEHHHKIVFVLSGKGLLLSSIVSDKFIVDHRHT